MPQLRLSWSPEKVEILKRMWLNGAFKAEIAKTLKRSITAIYRKGEKLGLPRKHASPHRMKLEPIEIVPTQGVRKCHNCLQEIELSKNGLDKDYRGASKAGKWIFWHLPGQCPKDPNTHADLFQDDLPDDDDPDRFYRSIDNRRKY